MRRVHWIAAVVALVLASTSIGCGSSKSFGPSDDPIIPYEPDNTSPDGAVRRLFLAYQYLDTAHYDTVLAANFRYHFSGETDPTLVYRYGGGWDKAHEAISFAHFEHGFTDSAGGYVPPAVNVVSSLVNDVVSADTAHADSAAWYQVVSVSSLNLAIDVAASGGGTTTFDISAPFVFHVVRGDAAVLAPGQANVATRWYVSAIDDLSPAAGASVAPADPTMPLPTRSSTWGSVRSLYYGP